MLVPVLQLFLSCAITINAVAVNHDRYHYHYKRAAGDSRSPCPAINTLANHGYINRDGKGITLDELNSAVMGVYNLDIVLVNLFTHGGNLIVQNTTIEGIVKGTVDLSDYDKHGAIEHDGSLSRLDFSQGDNVSFQPKLLAQLLDDSDSDSLTIDSLAKSRARREADMAARGNPPLDGKGTFIAYGEAALILETFGKGTNQAAKNDVDTFFTQERLPDGYEKPTELVSLSSTMAISAQIQAAAALHRVVGRKG